jgi:secreted trypsin-like serine protease
MFKILVAFVLLLSSSVSIAENELIGGREARPGEYPEVVRIRSGNSACSSSLVGPRVLISAAHCTTEDGSVVPLSEQETYVFDFEQSSYTARCKIAPDYRGTTGDQDLAVCKIDRPVSVAYASISTKPLALGDLVTIAGYGCVRQGGGGGNDGTLRVGDVSVTRLPSDSYYSFHTQGSVAACFGDSGGPVFRKGTHEQVGIVSRGDIATLSLLTASYHPKSLDFLRRFEQEQGVEICGLSLNCSKSSPQCSQEIIDLKRAVEKVEQCLR